MRAGFRYTRWRSLLNPRLKLPSPVLGEGTGVRAGFDTLRYSTCESMSPRREARGLRMPHCVRHDMEEDVWHDLEQGVRHDMEEGQHAGEDDVTTVEKT